MFFLNYPLFLGGILENISVFENRPLKKSACYGKTTKSLRLLHAMISNLSASRLVILVRRD